jgi:hypothetical protein
MVSGQASRLEVGSASPCQGGRRCPFWVKKQTSDSRPVMSALPPKADIDNDSSDVRLVPKADERHCSNLALFDHLVRASKHVRRRLIRNRSVAKAGLFAKMAARLRQPAARPGH